MANEGFERAALTANNDKSNDAQALSADQWNSMYNDRAGMYLMGQPKNESQGLTPEMVWNGAKMVPTSFAGFATGLRHGSSIGGVAGPLALAFGAEYLIDKTFFKDQPIRGGSMAFDFVAPVGIMILPLQHRYAMLGKAAAMVGSHVIGKLIDKHGR